MPSLAAALAQVASLNAYSDEPLARRTRFGIGGTADLYAEARAPDALKQAVERALEADVPVYVLGDGSNVIVADAGFHGMILRYTGDRLSIDGDIVEAEAGCALQTLVTATIDAGLAGLHTLERIPGSVGGAVYGNAGAYGRQIDEIHIETEYFDGNDFRRRTDCEFDYRESIFKRNKNWIIVSTKLRLERADRTELRAEASKIREIRDEKFPPTMRCAGSIFKNLQVKNLPAEVEAPESAVRAGKIASAYFLERVGAKGMREGGIEIASYHANLIYNAGGGTAAQLRKLILELKRRVREEFGIELEEEVQYVGDFDE